MVPARRSGTAAIRAEALAAAAGKGDGDVAVAAAEADLGGGEAGPAGGDVRGDAGGDGVPGLLVGRLRHAFHDGRWQPAAPLCRSLRKRALPLMLPDAAVPASLMTLLAAFAPLFTVPSFRTFWAVLEPLLLRGTKPGRPPERTKRQLIDGIRWRTRTGAPWRDVPP